jgi:hypothetical protein
MKNFKAFGIEIYSKMDQNKAIVKAVKFLHTYLFNSTQYHAEKLQKNLKTNKPEFLRLIAIYPQVI